MVLFFVCAAGTALAGKAGFAQLDGDWRTRPRADMEATFIRFDADGSFYIENSTSWYQGTYDVDPHAEHLRLLLDVADGSDTEAIGGRHTYSYEFDKDTLILSTVENQGLLSSQDSTGRAVFIAINYDSSEDDDDDDANFSIHASCFIAQSFSRQ